MGFFKREPTEQVVKKLLEEFGDIKDVKSILEEYLELNNTPIYQKLVFSKNRVDSSADELKIKNQSVLENLAIDNMSKFPLRLPFTPLITLHDFFGMYWFLGNLYSIHIGHNLIQEELNQTIQGDLSTRLIFLLDDFDSDVPTPKPTPQFFKKLSKIKWEKPDKKLAYLLENLQYVRLRNKWEDDISSFIVSEEAFIRFLIACSAVLNGRNRIKTKDIIRGHKTYLKLIKTDISKII